MNSQDIKLETAELGHQFTHREMTDQCLAVWGGVAWPGKRPGFAVVIGMDHKPHFDSHDIFLLDEYESFDMRQLIRQCGVLNIKYLPHRWIGDYKNDAASRFVEEMNREYEQKNRNGYTKHMERFDLNPTLMLEMESLYAFILLQIKDLLAPERRMLFLKGSKIVNYLSVIEESEIAELEPGEYPAIEALAFAVIELRTSIAAKQRFASVPEGDVWGDKENLLDFGLPKKDTVWES
jgi:hypothetical protein